MPTRPVQFPTWKRRIQMTCLMSICSLSVLLIAGCGGASSTDDAGLKSSNTPQGAQTDSTEPPVVNPREMKEDQLASLPALRIYSTPPGGLVFIENEVVRAEGDTFAQTPVEVRVPKGRIAVSVERPGGRRVTQFVVVPQDEEVTIDVSAPVEEPAANEKVMIEPEPSFLNAPLFEASVGRSIPLTTLNTEAMESDPFISSDGNTIWFVSERNGLRGIYSATRASSFHDFGEPKLEGATGGADQPASPSATSDNLILVYAIPEKARLWQVSRADTTEPFSKREVARTDESSTNAWRSSQISGDGLRVYWSEEGGDEIVSRAAVRASTDKLFGKTLKFDLPGAHPRLSTDGLRHFTFDGTKLSRARRGSLKQSFGPPEVIAELSLENFTPSMRHRQYWVTDDEQWMFYCDNPQTGGDLFVVRLSDGPGWGRIVMGKPIPPKETPTEPVEEKAMAEKPAEPKVDPRSLPLPYTTHWTELVKLLTARQSDEALSLIEKAMAEPALSKDRTLLQWDRELATQLAELNGEVNRAVESLQPGATVKFGGTRFEFDKREGTDLHLKLKDKVVVKSLKDFTPSDLVALVDSGPEKATAAQSLLFGIYLHFQGDSFEKVSRQWLKRGLEDGDTFLERLAARSLIQANKEIERGKFSDGIAFLDAAIAIASTSEAGKSAIAQKETLYDKLVWKPLGPRKWGRGDQGEFIADTDRANGSFLVSEQQYGDFELTCEWKVTGPTAIGGVYLRFDGRGNPFENGGKIHLANDLDQRSVDKYTTGSLFGSDAPTSNAAFPEGKWNTLRIRMRGKDVQVWINTKPVLKATLDKSVPDSGFVVLDGVAGGISYRKILVYDLPAEK